MRSLAADGFRGSTLGLLFVAAFLAAWAAWLLLARVPVYEIADTARLEADRSVYPIEAPITAQIATTHLTLGRDVRAGDLLVELDDKLPRLLLAEQRAYLAALSTQRESLHGQSAAAPQGQADPAVIEAELAATAAAIERLEYEIERYRIRAPADGQIGEIGSLQAGAIVREGDKLATLVPAGELKVVAFFLPTAALGRIQPGQAARLRLDSFPWTQYGTISASVARVASEARYGRVRVELAIHQDAASSIPLQHGLTGTIEIEVDRISPAALVLRSAGQLLTVPSIQLAFAAGHGGGQ
jgi:multidrug resistance efflux pump